MTIPDIIKQLVNRVAAVVNVSIWLLLAALAIAFMWKVRGPRLHSPHQLHIMEF